MEPLGAIDADRDLGKLRPGPGMSAAAVARHQRARIHRAVIDLVAEPGHDAVGLRTIARRAGVSSRTFYQQYSSKRECLLSVQELVAHRALNSVAVAQAGVDRREERIRGAVAALLREWSEDPRAASLMLFAGESADREIRSGALKAMRAVGLGFGNGVDPGAGGVSESSRLIDQGIVGGLVGVARKRLLEGRASSLARLSDELGDWAVALRADAASLKGLDRLVEARCQGRSEPHMDPSGRIEAEGEEGAAVVAGDRRALLLAAIGKLSGGGDPNGLTPSDIASLAGLRKKDFLAYFSTVEECFGASIEQRLGGAITAAVHAGEVEGSPAFKVYRVIAELSCRIAADRSLAHMCLEDRAVVTSSGLRVSEWRVEALRKALDPVPSMAGTKGDVALDASLGAMWSALRRRLSADWWETTATDPVLGYLVLAPIWGPEAAYEAISTLDDLRLSRMKQQ